MNCVGQIKGYPSSTLSYVLMAKSSQVFTLENEGIDVKENAERTMATIKIDLNSDLSILKNYTKYVKNQ